MARYEEKRTYPTRTPDECYAAAEKLLPTVGFEIWKTRSFAWLIFSRLATPEDTIRANVIAAPGGTITVAIGGDHSPEARLREVAAQIFTVLETKLLA